MITKHQQAAKGMLDAVETFMSGKPLTDEQRELQDCVFKAGCYAAAAYDAHSPKSGGEVHNLVRAFLTALIDPLSEELDYLRIDPAAGEQARIERKQQSN